MSRGRAILHRAYPHAILEIRSSRTSRHWIIRSQRDRTLTRPNTPLSHYEPPSYSESLHCLDRVVRTRWLITAPYVALKHRPTDSLIYMHNSNIEPGGYLALWLPKGVANGQHHQAEKQSKVGVWPL
jgi:hypothetical protein